jgi:hypothetical protein
MEIKKKNFNPKYHPRKDNYNLNILVRFYKRKNNKGIPNIHPFD